MTTTETQTSSSEPVFEIGAIVKHRLNSLRMMVVETNCLTMEPGATVKCEWQLPDGRWTWRKFPREVLEKVVP